MNGVTVSADPLYQTQGTFYINSQIGEDLVTNPNAESIPEEILLDADGSNSYSVVRFSNQGEEDEQLLSAKHLRELGSMLSTIHARFRELYGLSKQDEFAMEIPFKITSEGTLAIKQARPWVF